MRGREFVSEEAVHAIRIESVKWSHLMQQESKRVSLGCSLVFISKEVKEIGEVKSSCISSCCDSGVVGRRKEEMEKIRRIPI